MAQTTQVGSHKTSIFTDNEGLTKVVYHSTAVVSFNDKKIILNSGGWETNTTKLRMNQTSYQFYLGFSVYQKNNNWFVTFENETIPFKDGLELKRN